MLANLAPTNSNRSNGSGKGKSPKKASKASVGAETELFGGLNQQKAILNAWGFEVNQADILSAFNELDPQTAKAVRYPEFSKTIVRLKLNWDDNKKKAVWTALDENKRKEVNLAEFQSGLRSTDPGLQEFYRVLFSGNEFDPEYNDYGDAPSKPNERLKWLRNFAKKARAFEKVDSNAKDFDWQDVSREIRLVCRCITTPKFIADDKKFSAFSMWTQFGKHYLNSTRGLIARDMCIFYARVAQKVPEAFYKAPGRVFDALSYWINMKGSYSTEYAFATLKVSMISAPHDNKSLHAIANGIADIILKEHGAMTSNWLQRWLFLLNVWSDTHNMKKFDSDIWQQVSSVCELGVNHKDETVRHDGLQLLSRMDIHAHEDANKILSKLTSQTRKRYKRDYGPAKLAKYLDQTNETTQEEFDHGQSRLDTQAASPRTKKVRQKGVIGTVGANYAAEKMNKGNKLTGKQRIADVTSFTDLLNPYEMPITPLDVEMAFRYADMNSDGAISQKDFVLSLAKVGIEKTDIVAKEYFTYLSPKVKPLKLKQFQDRLEQYAEDFQPWFCRLISHNHLLRQPYSTDKSIRQLKKVLKDTRKLIWRQKIEAMYALCRGLARQVTPDQFKIKFQPMCKFWCAALKDSHPLVARGATIALTKMTWYQRGGFTKFLKPILDALIENFKRDSDIHSESSFGLFANIIKHVPDTKTFIQFQTLKDLVTAKQSRLQKYGWRLLAVLLERIVGLNKKRPDQWWGILDSILEHGTSIKKDEVAEIAIISYLILESSQFKKDTVYKYRKHYPKTKKNIDEIRTEFFEEVQRHIQEYQDEAKQVVTNLDMFSLLSETTDEEKDDGSEQESAGSQGHLDDMPTALHAITSQYMMTTYEQFAIKTNYNQIDTLNAALMYHGFYPPRASLLEIKRDIDELSNSLDTNNNDGSDGAWTPELFALFTKHAYSACAQPWSNYYESIRIAADILEVDKRDVMDVPVMDDPKAYLSEKIEKYRLLGNDNNNDCNIIVNKCNLIASMYAPFGTPEVENDAMLFDKLMEMLNPLFLNELKFGNFSLIISEICICLARIVQYHVSRFESYGTQYYDQLFRLMAKFLTNNNNKTSIIFHSCSEATFIIGKLVDFLSVQNACKMTSKLVECITFSEKKMYQSQVYKTLVASVMTNVPIDKRSDDDLNKILKMWDECKKLIYQGLSDSNNSNNQDIVRYSAVCIAYLYEIEYINFKENDNENIPKTILTQMEDIVKNASWESIFDIVIEVDDDILKEYGWNEMSKAELNERRELIEKWHEMELKSSNAIGMANVMKILQTLNRATKDNNRAEARTLPTMGMTSSQQASGNEHQQGGGPSLTLENLNRLQESFQGNDADQEDDAKST